MIDEYCAEYKDIFKEVRSYECLKYLHLGIIAPIPRKSLPEKESGGNHSVWILSEQSVRANKWCDFERVFSDGKSETR